MDKIKIYIKDKYGLSNYQMAQLTFVIKSTSSELSKILLMGIAFQNHLKLYIFLLIIMCFLKNIFRWSSFLHIQKVPTGIHHIYGNYHLLFFKNIASFICTIAFINCVYYVLLFNRSGSL